MDNIIKGEQYERQVLAEVLKDPSVKIAYLWKDVPEDVLDQCGILFDLKTNRLYRIEAWREGNPLPDTGTDIVAVKHIELTSLIQCKNHRGTVHQSTLAGIFRMVLMFKLPGEIWYSNKISRIVSNMPPDFKRLKLVKFPYTPEDVPASVPAPKLVLRDYQIEAVAALHATLDAGGRAILDSACGTGEFGHRWQKGP